MMEKSGSPVVECLDVAKQFGDTVVLAGVSLLAHAGESVAIVGPSGSGKSTLLSLIGLLASPSGGSVSLFGRPAPRGDGPRAEMRRQRMSFVFQQAASFAARSALDNVSFALIVQGMARRDADARAADYLQRVGLLHRAETQARRLSGGEQQRLELARAMARETDLIVCDEPTASLDRANAALVSDLLVTKRARHTTVIVATHDMAVAERCDRALRLSDGRILDPDE